MLRDCLNLLLCLVQDINEFVRCELLYKIKKNINFLQLAKHNDMNIYMRKLYQHTKLIFKEFLKCI